MVITLSMSSCFKKWTCTCNSYKVYFSDEFVDGQFVPVKDTSLISNEMQFFSSKKKAKSECDKQLSSSREHATSIGADPTKITCTLK